MTCNHPQRSTMIHNKPQRPTMTYTMIHNNPQWSAMTHNHPQRSTTKGFYNEWQWLLTSVLSFGTLFQFFCFSSILILYLWSSFMWWRTKSLFSLYLDIFILPPPLSIRCQGPKFLCKQKNLEIIVRPRFLPSVQQMVHILYCKKLVHKKLNYNKEKI